MTGGAGPTDPRSREPEARDPEVAAVLDGRDSLRVDDDMVAEAPSAADAARRESLLVRIRKMSVAMRVKLALTGNKEARQVLAHDSVKLVQACVLKNPRFTLEEALAMAKNRSLAGELLRTIADQRDWVRNYSIRLALVQNPKTPLQVALGLLNGIQDRDMRILAKSRNVASVLQSQAKRNILRRDGGGA
ncbi:hypothetical protein K2Z84_19790 [Candidatus Binatia bacterium]|nr:hypothetical protein [Candidatus Binatia bacterium]